MKDYDPGYFGLTFIFSFDGSVFPRSFLAAIPNACLAIGIWYFWRRTFAENLLDEARAMDVSQVWSAFNFLLGFAVSYRSQRAYSRWWEGGTLLQQARGEWFNAYSSLVAFCSHDPKKFDQVCVFQHALSRLVSMLHASALMSVSTEEGIDFEVIDATGIQPEHVDYLRAQNDKCEVIMQWIQRLIVDNMENGVIPIPPPVLSRVFQELSRGIVNIHNVRKITEFQFPFPLAQMITTMLIVQWFVTPLVCGLLIESPIWASVLSFFPIFACWGINFIAAEIEQPFGTDANDMPMHFMQASLNTSIMSLLDTKAQNPPAFDMEVAQVQCEFPQPSKSGSAAIQKLPPMCSAVGLTVQDLSQLHRLSRRYIPPRPPRRSANYNMAVNSLSRQGSMPSCLGEALKTPSTDNSSRRLKYLQGGNLGSSSTITTIGEESSGLEGLAYIGKFDTGLEGLHLHTNGHDGLRLHEKKIESTWKLKAAKAPQHHLATRIPVEVSSEASDCSVQPHSTSRASTDGILTEPTGSRKVTGDTLDWEKPLPRCVALEAKQLIFS